MVFPTIGKRKLSNINESNKSNTRRTITGPSSESPNNNRAAKLKSIANSDFNNKNLKTTIKTKIDDSPAQKSKFQKVANSDQNNSLKTNRNNTDNLTNCLNSKKTVIKQTNESESKQQQIQPYPYFNDNFQNYNKEHLEMFNFGSIENYQKNEKLYEQRIKSLKEQLDKLKSFKELANVRSGLIQPEINNFKVESGYNYLAKFLSDVNQIEKESAENICIVNNWYEKQKTEVELQYNIEKKRAAQEFQDKRRELKESLRNENEEKRKQIEIDRNTIDINMDNTDTKPTTTRKLRRRFNGPISNLANGPSANFDFSMDSNSFDLDSAAHHLISSGIGPNSIISSSSVLLQGVAVSSGLNIIGTSTAGIGSGLSSNVNSNCLNGSSVNSYYANVLNNMSTNNNERKRKLGPAAITFTISEDEINDDLKCLS